MYLFLHICYLCGAKNWGCDITQFSFDNLRGQLYKAIVCSHWGPVFFLLQRGVGGSNYVESFRGKAVVRREAFQHF